MEHLAVPIDHPVYDVLCTVCGMAGSINHGMFTCSGKWHVVIDKKTKKERPMNYDHLVSIGDVSPSLPDKGYIVKSLF